MISEKRVAALYGAVVLCAVMMITKLWNLSNPENNESMAVLEGQYTGRIDVCSHDGFVYDRNGELLSHKKSGRIALVNPAECENQKECAEYLSRFSESLKKEEIYKKIAEGIPFTLSVTDSFADAREGFGLYSFDLYEKNTDCAKHFLGYTDSYGKGVCGLLGYYDKTLHEKLKSSVYAVFDVNAKRKSMSPFELYSGSYSSDDGITTTIDASLQRKCDSFSDVIESGAVIVSDIESGEILALSSFPNFDAENLSEVLDSDKGELVDRTTRSFAPGSVFKMVLAAAALQKDETFWDMEYTCQGSIKAGNSVFRCHNRQGHGSLSMADAFAKSCNTYFINLGREIGLDEILSTMKSMGLDTPASAGFLSESTSFFPDPDNKSPEYLAGISFGQADLCLSPLDMTVVTSSVVSGYRTDLSVIDSIVINGEKSQIAERKSERIFDENVCEKMRIMMEKCIEEGTGRSAKTDLVKAGGKTATAQTGRFTEDGVEYVHKWFCGVYPSQNPRYTICVLCDFSTEKEMSNSIVFSEICKYFYEKE